jgi:hypothetical protein
MVESLVPTTIHSTEDGAIFSTETTTVQKEVTIGPAQGTEQLRPLTEGEEPIVETVGAPMLGGSEVAAPIVLRQVETRRTEEQMVVEINNSPIDRNQVDTVLVSLPSSPTSMAATAVTAS